MWPVYDGGTEFLENAGLLYAGDLTAMCLAPERASLLEKDGVAFERITSENAVEWAKAMWLGFGGDGEAPEEYRKFSAALAADRKRLFLSAAKAGGEYAGTFLLTNAPDLTGVYYFATVPEFRRQGIASAMMSEICRLSAGKRIVLQATPMGRNFYKAFGFEELFRIPVYSNDGDIL